eukprot:m.422886 g.422886  ORF g.422886 m.422886 type:complete len:74 (+) comp38976_c0_seq1:279-500(+)
MVGAKASGRVVDGTSISQASQRQLERTESGVYSQRTTKSSAVCTSIRTDQSGVNPVVGDSMLCVITAASPPSH